MSLEYVKQTFFVVFFTLYPKLPMCSRMTCNFALIGTPKLYQVKLIMKAQNLPPNFHLSGFARENKRLNSDVALLTDLFDLLFFTSEVWNLFDVWNSFCLSHFNLVMCRHKVEVPRDLIIAGANLCLKTIKLLIKSAMSVTSCNDRQVYRLNSFISGLRNVCGLLSLFVYVTNIWIHSN